MNTEQVEFWQSEFGVHYTERNTFTVEELGEFYTRHFGVTRERMNRSVLGDLPLQSFLEVGCNVGNQLRCLQSMGYKNLYGIELQHYAVEKAKSLTEGINIILGNAFDLPFKDGYFDVVFTSGVLIHISPDNLPLIMDEMVRTSKRYIWGFEYYSESIREIDYRGNANKLWKADYKQLFLDRYPSLRLVKEQRFDYVGSDNSDNMYLLEKH